VDGGVTTVLAAGPVGQYRRGMPSPGPVRSSAADTAPRLAPRWAAPVAVTAVVLGGLLAALVWRATTLDRVDAWVLRGQDLAYDHAKTAAVIVSDTLVPVVLVAMLTAAVAAWRAKRRDAAVLALTAAPAALAAELVLKRLVDRQWEGGSPPLFPSGHMAVANAAAVTIVLVVRLMPVAPRTRLAVGLVAGGYALLMGVARLVETVHSLTDVLGGVATGLAVTLGVALVITAWTRHRLP
jgi:membrane-associated phospholipid phosphatase